jgi:hypothetical protein
MSSNTATVLSPATLDDDTWDDLPSFIEERRVEAYFHHEWSHALDRVRNMAGGALFILPVSVDATDVVNAHVPEKFKALHFIHLPGGQVTEDFAGRLSDFVHR